MTNMCNQLNKGENGRKWLGAFAVSPTLTTSAGIARELRCILSI